MNAHNIRVGLKDKCTYPLAGGDRAIAPRIGGSTRFVVVLVAGVLSRTRAAPQLDTVRPPRLGSSEPLFLDGGLCR
jgi:hypothetical protein